MTFHYSQPFEKLIEQAQDSKSDVLTTAHAVIVGSGYGGSIVALRLAGIERPSGREHGVIVLERGREYRLGDFPTDMTDLGRFVGFRTDKDTDDDVTHDALFDLRLGKDVYVLVGSGLGGTSLINANVAIQPSQETFETDRWPTCFRTAAGRESLKKAFGNVRKWLDVPDKDSTEPTKRRQYAALETLQELPKYQALGRLANALELDIEPAPINVALGNEERTNHAGVIQKPCTRCGNCVTGCNVGAKSTLAMNLIPAAHARGVEFFTGGVVYSVEPIQPNSNNGRRWRVYVKPTSLLTRARCPERYCIETDIVVLAAGTLGSTEILARSAKLGYLACSTMLGQRFSTNGDGLAASFGEKEPVNAIGAHDFVRPRPEFQAGPTITACVRPRNGAHPFLLQDGAIPSPLVELIGEVATTAAQFGRLGDNRKPAWFNQDKNKYRDVLAVHPEAQRHGQVFLTMCDDGARGELRFKGEPGKGQNELGTIVPTWEPNGPKRASIKAPSDATSNNPALDAVMNLLEEEDRKPGLNYGQFLHNPLWRLLPESARSAMSGTFPGDRLVTVHPLGGCAMADSGQTGVVDCNGRVFRGETRDVYEGLHVLDGSIVPGALGANPFLTIAALAWRACDELVSHAATSASQEVKQPLPPPDEAPPAPLPADARIAIREQLVGALSSSISQEEKDRLSVLFPKSHQWFERDRLVLRIETEPDDTELALRGGADALGEPRRVRVRASLYVSPVTGDQARRWKTYGISSARLGERPMASGTGTMTMMEEDRPQNLLERSKAALAAYKSRRTRKWWQKLAWLLLFLYQRPVGNRPRRKDWFGEIMGFLSVAEMHATWRRFSYDVELRMPGNKVPITIRGHKLLSWCRGHKRLWTAFTQLDARFVAEDLDLPLQLYADMDYLVDDGLLGAAPVSRNVPHAIFNCLAYVARLARSAVQVGFWEFGAPDYPASPIKRTARLPSHIAGVEGEAFPFAVQSTAGSPESVNLVLHRYGRDGKRGPILLLHGLAQGSLIFAHERFGTSMAAYFLNEGYDVWLLDYRLSTQLETENQGDWSIDEIGEFDIPGALDKIRQQYGAPPKVHIFAHCVGAAATAMAILRGRITGQVASVAFNAIHPWIMPSPYNQVRAKLGVAFRDYVGNEYLDPIIQPKDDLAPGQAVLDRVAFSLARMPEREADTHPPGEQKLASAICDRMTFLYGRMWRHANIEAIHPAWRDLVGKAPAAVYRHLFYFLTRGRLVDREGHDQYIDGSQLSNWRGIRTLFLHGEESEVFNPQSATRSAIRLRQAMRRCPEVNTPVRLRRIPDFGHMDPILGDGAPDESYPYVHHFFQGKFDHSDVYQIPDGPRYVLDNVDEADDPDVNSRAKMHCGPILRSARMDNGQYLLRYWVELPTGKVEPTDPVTLLPATPASYEKIKNPCDIPECYVWIDARYNNPPSGQEAWPERLRLGAEDCHFIVASCCYPGTPFDRRRTDEAYSGINAVLDRGEKCDAMFLIGDQVYADATAGLLDPQTWRDRYEERYRTAFNSPQAQRALRRIPTHFAIDDHEIANDFAGPEDDQRRRREAGPNARRLGDLRTGRIDKVQLRFAKQAVAEYMGPGRWARMKNDSWTLMHWYELDHPQELNCPAFVMDTRSERKRKEADTGARLIGGLQLDALKSWLCRVRHIDRPKFIFMGSVIAPVKQDALEQGMWMREDGIAGYPAELDQIATCILDHQVPGVVFVSGDLHLSCYAELMLRDKRGSGKADIRALQIVSSGLYAPLTFINARASELADHAHVELGNTSIEYRAKPLGQGNTRFVKVGASRIAHGWSITVTPYARHGAVDGEPVHIEMPLEALEPLPCTCPVLATERVEFA